MKILLVDDDSALAEITAFALRRAGFLIVLAHDGEQAISLWEDEQPDLVILDIQLPKKDGLAVCRELRARSAVPIIMLTVRDDDEDIVYGLEIGADDYLTKPFSPKQLVARIHAVLRRSAVVPRQSPLSAGDLVLDTNQHLVHTPRGDVRLTRLEFRLLHYLIIHQGQVVPTQSILNHVWGYVAMEDRTLLKQLVYRLRQKIEAPEASEPTIRTVPGVGYIIPQSGQAVETREV